MTKFSWSQASRRLLFATAAAVICVLSPAVGWATPTAVIQNGQLIGANGVEFVGQTYQARFVDGACEAVFGSCSTLTTFTFPTLALALGASQALLDQIFADGAPAEDIAATSLRGCEDGSSGCVLFTPYLAAASTAPAFHWTFAAELIVRPGTLSDWVDDTTMMAGHCLPGDCAGWDTSRPLATNTGQTWIVWTASELPEPGVLLLVLSGLATILSQRMRWR